jgi:glycosyltransferase involved in cell wall biosynthesis
LEGCEVIKYIQNSKIKNKIIYKGYVSDEEMINLFAHATAFVYPSIYEGFGFPILEAMQLGTPVITSNIGAMKEIGESAATFFDPFNPEDIGGKIKMILQHEELRKKLIVKGYEHAKRFTWQKCVDQTIDVYATTLAYQNSAF